MRQRFAGVLLLPLLMFAAAPVLGQSSGSAMPLSGDCNNVTLTHPAGTPLGTVASGVSVSVVSIFR